MFPQSTHPNQTKLLQPALGWFPILMLVLFTAFCITLHLGSVIRIGFPAGCFIVATYLYFRYPILYIGFTWWLWFLTPFIRRLVDYGAGWLDPNPILLAPFLATLVAAVTFLRNFPKAVTGNGLPFVLCVMSIVYGFMVGLMGIPSRSSVVLAFLNWLAPVIFGYHLFSNWRQFPELRQLTQRIFLWSVLITGGYGVIQFLIAPDWDRFWLHNVINQLQILSFGRPNPLGIRVFSTMQSPQPFACTMVAGLLVLLSIQSPLKLISSSAGYLALLLTVARAAWLSWFVAILVFLPSLKAKLQMRLIITLMLMMIVVLPLATIEPFSTVINDRFQSLFAGTQDGSFIDRTEGYNNLLTDALREIEGRGIGFQIEDTSIGGNDSGILSMLLTLGWIGTLPYLGGLFLMIVSILRGREAASDPFVSACRAVAIATVAQISLNTVMLSAFGMIMWGFIGLSGAARVYYTQQQQREERPFIPLQLSRSARRKR